MTPYRQALGRWGESVAATYLTANGFQIIERNWRCRFGEVDLIGKKNGIYHFIEVKTRRGTAMGFPEEAVTRAKLERLQRCSLAYLVNLDGCDPAWTIDLIAIELDDGGLLLRIDLIDLGA